MSDIIAAISTAGGLSAIGIVRLSGDGAAALAGRVFRPASGASMSDMPDRRLVCGALTGADGEIIDQCMCTVSRAPHSYTGEDTAELHCHGSPVVLYEALRSVCAAGARQALPGEFTKRAFLNGRMDLSQAEAVIDLIEAESAPAAKNAAAQVAGAVRAKVAGIYSQLLNILAHFHAVIDYPDEDIDDFALAGYLDTLGTAAAQLDRLAASFQRGEALRGGIPAAIIGRPNTGKSSLLNAMLGYERAIVTDIAGTTRDTIEEKVRFGGGLLRLTDTAGIRDTRDTVEALGVERAVRAADEAALVLAVFDGSQALTPEDHAVIAAARRARRRLAVINKSDLPQALNRAALEGELDNCLSVSAKTGEGLDALEREIGVLFAQQERYPHGEILTNARQADAVRRAADALGAAQEAMRRGVTPDAALTELETALAALGEVTGAVLREDVTARIFERFCVGK